MKSFDEVKNPKVKQVRPAPANLDDFKYKYNEEVKRKEIVICRIVPALVARYPDLLDMVPRLRRNEEIGLVYKKVNEFLDN